MWTPELKDPNKVKEKNDELLISTLKKIEEVRSDFCISYLDVPRKTEIYQNLNRCVEILTKNEDKVEEKNEWLLISAWKKIEELRTDLCNSNIDVPSKTEIYQNLNRCVEILTKNV